MTSTKPFQITLSDNTILVIRDTFGIVDSKTGKLYPDIRDYWLETHYITKVKTLPNSFISSFGTKEMFFLHCDSKLKRELRKTRVVKVIVSFQKRTTGNFAFARLFFKRKE